MTDRCSNCGLSFKRHFTMQFRDSKKGKCPTCFFPLKFDPKPKKTGVLELLRKSKEKKKKKLLKMGWTTDGVWFYNPRSGYRYDYDGAQAIEELRAMPIDI